MTPRLKTPWQRFCQRLRICWRVYRNSRFIELEPWDKQA